MCVYRTLVWQGAADNDTVNLLMHNSNDRIIYDGIT